MPSRNTVFANDFKRCVEAQAKFFTLPLSRRLSILRQFGAIPPHYREDDIIPLQRRRLFKVFHSRYGFDALITIERS